MNGKKETDLDTKGIGAAPETRTNRSNTRDTGIGSGTLDFQREYADGFSKRLYIQQIQKTAIQNWIDRFPADVILAKLEQLGNPEATKEIKEQLQSNVQGWLQELDAMNEASKDINIDILRTASILARKDRERVE